MQPSDRQNHPCFSPHDHRDGDDDDDAYGGDDDGDGDDDKAKLHFTGTEGMVFDIFINF